MPTSISSESTEFIFVAVEGLDDNSIPINPTGDVVDLAVIPSSQAEPESGDWKTGSWETGMDPNGVTVYRAKVLVGPNASPTFPLTAGEYSVWVRVHDNPETPVKRSGQIIVF